VKLSVIVIAKNEALNIQRCLESVAFADEVVVLDSGSTDNTVELARTMSAKVHETDWAGYGVQKQRALDLATHEWVLNLDADEYVDERLKTVILQSMQRADIDGYRIPIQLSFYNKPLRFSARPTRHIRLFKRLCAQYSNDIVHEKIILNPGARIAQIKEPILHRSFQDLSHALYKINLYSSYSAKTYTEKHRKSGLLRTLAGTLWMFLRCYILQGGFLDGRDGFLSAALQANGSFFRGMKRLYPDRGWNIIP